MIYPYISCSELYLDISGSVMMCQSFLCRDSRSIMDAMKMISNGYPDAIQFNIESRIIYGKFLNIRIFNYPSVQCSENQTLNTKSFLIILMWTIDIREWLVSATFEQTGLIMWVFGLCTSKSSYKHNIARKLRPWNRSSLKMWLWIKRNSWELLSMME